MDNELKILITDWKKRLDSLQAAHLYVAGRFGRYHYAIGLPATICTAIAGATLFAEVSDPHIRMGVGIVAMIAAVLSAVQTFYSHARRSEQHRTASAQFGRIRRDIEILEQFPPHSKEESEQKIRDINEAIWKIDNESPIVESFGEKRFMKASRLLRTLFN